MACNQCLHTRKSLDQVVKAYAVQQDAHLQSHNPTDMCGLGEHLLQLSAEAVRCCSGDGAELAGGEPQKPRHTPEDSHTLEQIRGLKHGCCVVMLR